MDKDFGIGGAQEVAGFGDGFGVCATAESKLETVNETEKIMMANHNSIDFLIDRFPMVPLLPFFFFAP